MERGYRITVTGVMGPRFCAAFRGVRSHVEDGRTVLWSDSPDAPPLGDLLVSLGNLGLEIVHVERSTEAARPTLEA